MSVFTKDDTAILRRLGEEWTTNDLCFHGVFDAENRLETDTMSQAVIIAGSVLTCETKIAKDFVRHQQLTDQCGVVWYVREVLKINDGAISRVQITEKPE